MLFEFVMIKSHVMLNLKFVYWFATTAFRIKKIQKNVLSNIGAPKASNQARNTFIKSILLRNRLAFTMF